MPTFILYVFLPWGAIAVPGVPTLELCEQLGAQELRAAEALGDAGAFACVSVDDAAEELIG
jgi:hypothetical protein